MKSVTALHQKVCHSLYLSNKLGIFIEALWIWIKCCKFKYFVLFMRAPIVKLVFLSDSMQVSWIVMCKWRKFIWWTLRKNRNCPSLSLPFVKNKGRNQTMKSTTTAKHTFTSHFCKLWQEIPAYTNNKNDGNENDTMIESEALFSIWWNTEIVLYDS